jgi:hypothetical protein
MKPFCKASSNKMEQHLSVLLLLQHLKTGKFSFLLESPLTFTFFSAPEWQQMLLAYYYYKKAAIKAIEFSVFKSHNGRDPWIKYSIIIRLFYIS